MTCYLRVHNILAAVRPGSEVVDWDVVADKWQKATSVLERQSLLASMKLDEIDLYDLPSADLSPYCGLILAGRVDQEFLFKHRQILADFLNAGNTIVFSGDLDLAWLPGSSPALPLDNSEGSDFAVTFTDHPVFTGIEQSDLGYYFVSGHYKVPEGGEVIASLQNGEVAVYVDRVSTGGSIMVHAGHTLLGYAADASAENLAKKMVPQLLQWIRQEARQ